MAGSIPQNFIDELLTRVDIVDLIDAYVPLKKRGKEYIACCPFHNEKTPSFTVSAQKQFYHCFGCGAHGTAVGFLMAYEHLEFVEAIETLAERLGLEVPRGRGAQPTGHRNEYELLAYAAEFYRQNLKTSPNAIAYLKDRGLSGEIAAEFGLGFAPPAWDALIRHCAGQATLDDMLRLGLIIRKGDNAAYDRFRNRIIFPIRDRRGRVMGFGGRVLDDAVPKYLNSPETPVFHKGRSLYGQFESRQSIGTLQSVLIVEGYMDVVALAQHGVRNVVATLGTATTQQHVEQLFRLAPNLVFGFDGDRAGQDAAWRAIEQLLPLFRDGLDAKFLFLPQGEDPDSLLQQHGTDAFLERIKQATPLSDALFDHLEQGVDLSTPSGRAKLVNIARPLLDTLPDGVFRQLMFDRLSARVGIRLERLLPGQTPQPTAGARAASLPNVHSPMRKGIAMLLNDPALAQRVSSVETLGTLDLPGIKLLVQIIENFQAEPNLTGSAVLERYRGSEHHRHLSQLMKWVPPAETEYNNVQEFDDLIITLHAKQKEQRTSQLIYKERNQGLNQQEKAELRDLLQGR